MHADTDTTKDLLHSIFVSGGSFMAMRFTTEAGSFFEDDYHFYWSIDGGQTWKMTSLADKEQMESIHHSANEGYYMVVSHNREELFGDDQVNLYRLK